MLAEYLVMKSYLSLGSLQRKGSFESLMQQQNQSIHHMAVIFNVSAIKISVKK